MIGPVARLGIETGRRHHTIQTSSQALHRPACPLPGRGVRPGLGSGLDDRQRRGANPPDATFPSGDRQQGEETLAHPTATPDRIGAGHRSVGRQRAVAEVPLA